MQSKMRRVVVIGAGAAGLAAAVDLAARGYAVTVVERASSPGGKMRRVRAGTADIDAGPTVLTMRWVFDGLFEALGERLEQHLKLIPADILARHAWASGGELDLYTDLERSAAAIETFAGPRERRGFLAFCERAREIYELVEEPFIRSPKGNVLDLARTSGLQSLPGMWRSRPIGSLWQALNQHFKDPRLKQLFGRYATYVGSSPFQAPALLMLIAHVELQGVWMVEGGMHKIPLALQRIAENRGVTFHFGAEVAEIQVQGGRVAGVVLADDTALAADAVVCNADVNAIAQGLFGRRAAQAAAPIPEKARSLSAFAVAIQAPARGFKLARHNVFFADHYAEEFRDIFERQRLPATPTVYVCAQDRTEPEPSDGATAERFLFLINAPAIGDRKAFGPQETEPCLDQTFSLLDRCGLTIERQAAAIELATPTTFEGLFPATGGALYGAASHGLQAALKRPGSKTRLAGLYLAGGSVHPGAGVPMATLSGRLAAATLDADLGSTKQLRPVAMAGGTSTA